MTLELSLIKSITYNILEVKEEILQVKVTAWKCGVVWVLPSLAGDILLKSNGK